MANTTVIVDGHAPNGDVPMARRQAPGETVASAPMPVAPGYGQPGVYYAQTRLRPALLLRPAGLRRSAILPAALLRAAVLRPAGVPAVVSGPFTRCLSGRGVASHRQRQKSTRFAGVRLLKGAGAAAISGGILTMPLVRIFGRRHCRLHARPAGRTRRRALLTHKDLSLRRRQDDRRGGAR